MYTAVTLATFDLVKDCFAAANVAASARVDAADRGDALRAVPRGHRLAHRIEELGVLEQPADVIEAVDALAAAYSSKSALLKHEIAYVMGQMQDTAAVPYLIDRLEDRDEDLMVRHEAAEALGAIGDRTAITTLKKFVDDPEPVISESCEVLRLVKSPMVFDN